MSMNRRTFLKSGAVLAVGTQLAPIGCSRTGFSSKPSKKLLILGIDGMDPHLCREYMRLGLLPNLSRIAKQGAMVQVMSSIPPQSPVAWSSFTVGAPPVVHGIYDFIHRDPKTLTPYLSTSRVLQPERFVRLGSWQIPLAKGKVENLRQGKPFWDYLADRDIPSTIFKMPANFPCESDRVDMISGMGTPDLRGGYGNFTLFTTSPASFKKNMSGGRVIPITLTEHKATSELPGPVNTLQPGSGESSVPLTVLRDPVNPVVRVVLQGQDRILKEGEWSDWIQLSFPMLGDFYDVKGICRLYVKSIHPELSLYVSPINIDPTDPALPLCSSKQYARDLVRHTGYFYTQGFPEDTKALSEGVFTDAEYLKLGLQIIAQRERMLDYELGLFDQLSSGLLFFYFSSLDQDTHMFWRTIDPMHPMYDPELNRKYGDTLKKLYVEMDRTLGKIVNHCDISDPNFTLMVMSDHGFAPFRRQVNLNTWLYEQGYLDLNNSREIENTDYFSNVNWSRTGAYNVGINSLYLNLKGRERGGIVEPAEADSLRIALREELLDLSDPMTGQRAVSEVWIVPDSERGRQPQAPDLIVGWNRGFRTSWASILGGFSEEIFSDNLDKWSGDHCIDPRLVPAVLVTNRRVNASKPTLCDLTASILEEFNIKSGKEVTGNSIYSST